MTLRALMQRELPVTAPLVLNPLMARMAEAAGFPAGYLGGGSTGYLKVSLEANLNLTEMCQAALDIRAVSSLPLIMDAACGYGDPMHMHRTIGMSEAAGFAAIEIEDQLGPTQRGVRHHRAHERDAGERHRRRAPSRRGLPGGGRRRPAALDSARARAAPRHRPAARRTAPVPPAARRGPPGRGGAPGPRRPRPQDRGRSDDAAPGGV